MLLKLWWMSATAKKVHLKTGGHLGTDFSQLTECADVGTVPDPMVGFRVVAYFEAPDPGRETCQALVDAIESFRSKDAGGGTRLKIPSSLKRVRRVQQTMTGQ